MTKNTGDNNNESGLKTSTGIFVKPHIVNNKRRTNDFLGYGCLAWLKPSCS